MMSIPTLRNFFLAGPAGRIECLLKTPATKTLPPSAAAIVCHPHPLFGGTMHNKTVHASASALLSVGLPVLRFNFRGAGLSEGEHDSGRAEQEDLRAVIDHLATLYPSTQIIMAGYSFGAFVGLTVGCRDPRVAALIGIGMPVSVYDFTFLGGCPKPLAIIQGDRDRFGPLPAVMTLAANVASGITLLPVKGAAHDFAGHLDVLRERVIEALLEQLTTGSG